MNQLERFNRPWVVFDPANREHRKYCHEYLVKRTWSNCPYRFVIPDDFGDVASMIQRKLALYYSSKEFAKS